jgi:DNA-binding NarL/FixJ family response regulator
MGIRVIVAEVRGLGREGLCQLFATQKDFEIIGEADDGHAAVPLAGDLSPDVIVMSLKMRSTDSIGATRRILIANPAVRIVGMSADPDIHGVREFLAAGGAGFISKGNSFSELLRAIREVITKRIYLSPDIADALVANYVLHPPSDLSGFSSAALSTREREVLQFVAEGMTTKAAASALQISAKTVDMHRQRIMKKLKIHSVAELTKYAIREGIATLH